jgi:hypothetical protein
VASGGARRGRRDNGLDAAEYAAAGDVDPRVGEHLLDVLGLRGIAAYLQPAADTNPITRSTTLPARPTDRLYVDRAHLDTARAYLRQLTGPEAGAAEPVADPTAEAAESTTVVVADHPDATRDTGAVAPPAPGSIGGSSIDDLFAAIVAGYDRDVTGGGWPDAENLPAGDPPATGSALEAARPAEPDSTAPPLSRWKDSTVAPEGWRTPTDNTPMLDGFDADFDSDDDDEGYTPPPPPPLPRFAPTTVVAVLAIIAGVVVFFNPTLLPVDGTVAMVLGFLGILGGFVALIWRLRPGGDDDDFDPDDGAVV